MISKQQVKFVKSLKLKKYRKKAESFIVEGAKNVLELLESDFVVQQLFFTSKFREEHTYKLPSYCKSEICTEKELAEMGTFQTNEYALAVASMKSPKANNLHAEHVLLALDGVSDPGNLGTIIRIADWYGIRNILAGEDTADFYNPKVINASMGSFSRVSVNYLDLKAFFKNNRTHKVYGAFLNGQNIHTVKMQNPAVILLGNESKGISEELKEFTDYKITIPRIGKAESLNVAVSTAIICDNLLRD